MKRIIILLITMLLMGCEMHVPDRGQTEFFYTPPQDRQLILDKVLRFEASGSLSLNQEGRPPVIISFEIIQSSPRSYRIHFTSPLNLYTADLIKDGNRVLLWSDDKEHVTARSIEDLMYKRMGWTLPIEGLLYWIKATPAPGPCEKFYDMYGHLITLHQNGWIITFQNFKNESGYDFPTIVTLNRPSYHVRLAIKNIELYMRDIMYTDKRTLPCYDCGPLRN